MLKSFVRVLASAALIFSCIGSANASTLSINYTHALTGANGTEFTSPYTSLYNFQVFGFDNVNTGDVNSPGIKAELPWTWTGNASVVNGTLIGKYAMPYGLGAADHTNYLATPNPLRVGEVEVQLGALYNYFGLWWGSVDSYNTLSFYRDHSLVASFTGSEAIFPSIANGNQTASSTNVYINFLDLPNFDSVKFASIGYAFEVDNIALGNTVDPHPNGQGNTIPAPVPEPTTLFLLGAGLVGLVLLKRRDRL